MNFDLSAILNFLLTTVLPFVVGAFPIVCAILKKLKKAQKETMDVAWVASKTIKEAVDVLERVTNIIQVDDQGNVKIDPEQFKAIGPEITEVKLEVARFQKEIPEMVSAWGNLFKKSNQ